MLSEIFFQAEFNQSIACLHEILGDFIMKDKFY